MRIYQNVPSHIVNATVTVFLQGQKAVNYPQILRIAGEHHHKNM